MFACHISDKGRDLQYVKNSQNTAVRKQTTQLEMGKMLEQVLNRDAQMVIKYMNHHSH